MHNQLEIQHSGILPIINTDLKQNCRGTFERQHAASNVHACFIYYRRHSTKYSAPKRYWKIGVDEKLFPIIKIYLRNKPST